MGDRKIYCFSANRICHHDDYYLLIHKIRPSLNIKSNREKRRLLITNASVVFFDIDGADLAYIILILLRGSWGAKGLAISVRTEYLLEKRSLFEFIFQRGRLVFIKSLIKRILFYLIKNFSSTTILSIHKNHPQKKEMETYVNYFLHDPQLWDLDILKINPSRPGEIKNFVFDKSQYWILVGGRFNEQRSKNELLDFLAKNNELYFIFAGVIESEDFNVLQKYNNCFVINRHVSNAELLYLYDLCSIIYCYYTNDRPSGFFGRAVQLQKNIIIRKDKFLHNAFGAYKKLISIDVLDDLKQIDIDELILEKEKGSYNFNDASVFINFVNEL